MLSEKQIKALQDYCKETDIQYLGVFGSHAKGLDQKTSDIDLIIRVNKSIGLFQFAKIKRELSQVLDKEVDLVTENGLSPYLREEILKTTKALYNEAG